MNSSSFAASRLQNAPGRFSSDAAWGAILVIPYVVVFVFVVVYPILYGLFLGSNPGSYRKLFQDPIYLKSAWNTLVFLIVAVNLKLLLALLLSGFFYNTERWIRWLSIIFLLPWAAPSLPAIFSIRWMFNSEWGMINGILSRLFGTDGPLWLVKPDLAFGLVIATHIWKNLPFWTLILLAGRMAIPPGARLESSGDFKPTKTNLLERAEYNARSGVSVTRKRLDACRPILPEGIAGFELGEALEARLPDGGSDRV